MSTTATQPIIRATPCVWAGVRFRSKLEAMWAFVFEDMLWRWEYEPSRFYWKDGFVYWPDFYLPDFDLWFEVKPARKVTAEEFEKAIRLAALVRRPVIIDNTGMKRGQCHRLGPDGSWRQCWSLGAKRSKRVALSKFYERDSWGHWDAGQVVG